MIRYTRSLYFQLHIGAAVQHYMLCMHKFLGQFTHHTCLLNESSHLDILPHCYCQYLGRRLLPVSRSAAMHNATVTAHLTLYKCCQKNKIPPAPPLPIAARHHPCHCYSHCHSRFIQHPSQPPLPTRHHCTNAAQADSYSQLLVASPLMVLMQRGSHQPKGVHLTDLRGVKLPLLTRLSGSATA